MWGAKMGGVAELIHKCPLCRLLCANHGRRLSGEKFLNTQDFTNEGEGCQRAWVRAGTPPKLFIIPSPDEFS